MPEHARVWIYQADRSIEMNEVDVINARSTDFIEAWTSHGAALDASYSLLFNRVLVIAADENQVSASGCGIDKSVNFVKKLGDDLGVDFFQRTVVLFKQDNEWNEAQLHQFWAMRKANLIGDETMVLDTTVRTIGQLRAEFIKPFKSSWHAEMWGR